MKRQAAAGKVNSALVYSAEVIVNEGNFENMSKMRSMKKWLIKCLIVIFAIVMLTGSAFNADTVTITRRVTVYVTIRKKRSRRKRPKPYLDYSKCVLFRGDSTIIKLRNASKKGVKWSVSKKIVTLKKKGNKVVVSYKKAGSCKIKAKYKGKTYSCKIVCYNSLEPNTVEIFENKPVTLECSYLSSPIPNTESYLISNFRPYKSTLSFYVENPKIAVCKWDPEGWRYDKDVNENPYLWSFLWIGGLRPGHTRVVVKNSYNPDDKKYINVNVVATAGEPIIERDPTYDPFD